MYKSFFAAVLAAMLLAAPLFAQRDMPPTRPTTPPSGFDIPIARPAAPQAELPDPKPVYRYELKQEHGEFMVVVKSFKSPAAGDPHSRAKELAEGLVEYIRKECRLYAYVHESGWAQRQERKKEKEAVTSAARKYYQAQGFTEEQVAEQIRKVVKIARVPDEYSVLVAPGKGTLKNIDEALDFAKYVRKLPAPPAEYCDEVVVGTVQEITRTRGEARNPFPMAMPGRNPTLPKKESAMERPVADDFLMSINAGKPHSLIHNTKKPFTLVVKTYGTNFGQVQKPGEFSSPKSGADGAMLERAAQQAHLVAQVLRQQKPPFDAYVMHTRFESFVCVGEYDTKDDKQLKANAEALKSFAIKDQKTGQVLETFMEKPMPAWIPRPR